MLYEHSLRIPMVVKGLGVPLGVRLPIMGTNVDDAPTWLALTDIDTPATMDGRQLATAGVSNCHQHVGPDAACGPAEVSQANPAAAASKRPQGAVCPVLLAG